MNIWEYMNDSPWMTFFWMLCLYGVVGHTFKGLAVLLRGYPPAHCNSLGEQNKRLHLLKRIETEMRYAGWNKLDLENVTRKDVYDAVKKEIGDD